MTVNEIIYGVEIPITTHNEYVEDWGYADNSKEQYWRRNELPKYFNDCEFDRDGNVLLTTIQEDYAREEVRRCREGFSFYNNGKIVTVTGKHYFYLQWWKLENDVYPDFRDTDRRYFCFLNYFENKTWCLGVVRGKKRREGATSQATSNLIYECIFFKNSKCGLTSKSNIDAKRAFTDMASFGYRQLPVFLRPTQLNNKDSVSELVFAHKSVSVKGAKGGVIDNDTGHRSRLDYKAPSKNAYDSGRLSRGMFDEGGKWDKEAPFSEFIKIVSKTLVQGAKRVGFIECPSTVNEMTKSGGEEFKKVWDNADQFKFERTPNRLVRYFSPAYDGYVGFIDRYGMSVIDEPTEEQYEYLIQFIEDGDLTKDDIKAGAKKYLQSLRLPLKGSDLEEEIRMNPFDEEEMFMYAGTGCEFIASNIQKQLLSLEEKPIYLRRVRLVRVLNDELLRNDISFMDDENGDWLIYEKPQIENNFKILSNSYEPLNTSEYCIGVDTYKNIFAANGSKGTICVFKKSNIVKGVEHGLYPVAYFVGRPRLLRIFNDEVLKAALWFGCKVNYEMDAGTFYYEDFAEWNALYLLEWTPAVDPANPKKVKPGTESGNPFQLAAQLEAAKKYIDGTNNDTYNGNVHRIVFPELLKQLLKYDHSERTPYDSVIALMMALLVALKQTPPPKKVGQSLLKTFDIKF